ncbi:MAG: protoporphyrinogen/coproporphyrinogen oxidase [Ferrimicrobium acidiphilum]
MKVLVAGGGISGLASSWELMRLGHEVTMLEQDDRLGGKLQTMMVDSIRVELGPDSYLRRNPSANELLNHLELDEISPAAGKALLYTSTGRQPIPAGLNLGAPTQVHQALTNHLVPLPARLRAAAGVLRSRWRTGEEGDDLGAIVSNRFGRRWSDANVEPLVGGINANTIYGLSARTSAPAILAGKLPASPGGSMGPAFGTPSTGLSALVAHLRRELEAGGCRIVTSAPVQSVERSSPSNVTVATSTETYSGQRLLIALPSFKSASLLGPIFQEGLDLLRSIHYSSVSMLIAYSSEPLPPQLAEISGVLVARDLGLMTTAVSIASNKWPDWTGRVGTLVRVSTGSLYDRRHLRMNDDELRETLSLETSQILGHQFNWAWNRIVRWDRSFPHFRPYHEKLIAQLDARLFDRFHGDIALTGSYVSGSGIPTCIATARSRSRQLVS